MAAAPLIFMAASAAISAVGAIQQGKAQAANARSAQNAANYNATVEKMNANAAEGAASANERAQRLQNDQQMGLERARVGESGGGFVGTNVGVLAQNGANLELNALNTRYSGQQQAAGLLSQANLNEYQAANDANNAKQDEEGGYISAAAGALKSFSSYGSYSSLGGG